MNISIRKAKTEDLEQIDTLMKRSMNTLGIGYYSPKQLDSFCQFVCVPDQQLIADQTFFVITTGTGTLVGCGGWSFRKKLYAGPTEAPQEGDRINPLTDPARIRAMFIDPDYSGQGIGSLILEQSEKAAKAHGFSKGALGSTLSGLSFYIAKGWNKVSEEQAILSDGIAIQVIQMEKSFS